MSAVCRLLGMSRQNYYARRKERQRRQVDEALVEQLVKRERQEQPRLGGRKLRIVLEGALAERVNGILKSEYGLDRAFKSKADCRQAVRQAIRLYRTRRPHTALGYRIPAEVHRAGLQPPDRHGPKQPPARVVNKSPSPEPTSVQPQGGAS